MRTIIYGDIHGCLDELKALRAILNVSEDDREILVGDLIDRGPYSNEVVTYAREEKLELVMGNHEYKYVRYHQHEKQRLETGRQNPMKLNEEKTAIYEQFSEADIAYLDAAPFFININNLTVLHAGITNKITLENATKKELEQVLRIRTLDENQNMLALGQTRWNAQFWSEWYDGNQGIIVYGHEARTKVKIDKYSFGIDTGCVYGDRLTALVVTDTVNPMFYYDIVQVSAKEVYSSKKS